MLGTALARLSFAASMAFGRPFSRWSLDRLIDAMLHDPQRELGAIDGNRARPRSDPPLDDETRADMQRRRFRTQATLAGRETAYYGRLFKQLGLDPLSLNLDNIQHLPITPK